ncbi:MAG: SDR family NAD(P)-dependent oxidoreductase [Acidobacteriota bacterium]
MSSWNQAGHGAVITGAASGIGLAAGAALARRGMNVLLADRDAEALQAARERVSAEEGPGRVLTQSCDVSQPSQIEELAERAFADLGAVHCLMNNAGAGFRVGRSWENLDECRETLEINLWGIVLGCHAFVPKMLASGEPGVVINTGSKQGITKPPGNYAYNLSKAGVLAYTEGLAHDLSQEEDSRVSAHLFVPGFTYTGMISRFVPEKPPAAWTPEQTVDYLFGRLEEGDFYVLCPDNEVTRDVDAKRIQWNADDLIQNRPALSRWHRDWKDAFERFQGGDD